MSIKALNQYRVNNTYGKINYGDDSQVEASSQSQSQSNTSQNKSQNFFTISKQGKAMSVIDTLSKQKDKILEIKNELISQTLANGSSLVEIKSDLKSYDVEISKLEEKIAAERVKEREEALKKKKEDSKIYSRPVKYTAPPDESLTSQLSNIANQYGEHIGYYHRRL
ncbi:hypothetical protein [Candidatus Epulonipiscium viviparus]|uniref:hypothetical protein n=1 Tax=Candidatus Epulonipiscium viviparus TaxID=420336 RepID=UPI00016BFB12|nr:hypothetical protein [Candidatus Epulopiscium viviparus]